MSGYFGQIGLLARIGFLLGCWSLATATLAEATQLSSPDLSAVRSESAESIRRIKSQFQQAAGGDVSASLLDEMALWRQIDLIVAQRQTVLAATQAVLAESEATAGVDGEITEFINLERTRETLAIAESKLESLQNEMQVEHSLLLDTKSTLQRVQQNRRRTTESLLTASNGSRQSLKDQERLDAVRVRLHEQQLALHRDTLAEMTERQSRIELSITQLRDRIARAGSEIRMSKAELDQQLTRIAGMEQAVRRQLDHLDQQLHRVLVASTPPEDDNDLSNLEVIREESQLLRQLLSEIAAIRECWKKRYRLSNEDAIFDELMTWRDEARQAEQRMAQIQNRLASRTMERRQQVATVGLPAVGGNPRLEDISTERAQIEEIIQAYGNLQVLAANARRTYSRFAEDLEARHSRYSFQNLSAWAGNRFRSVWEYELTSVDDQSITVGKLVIALLLLIVGVIISRWMTSIIAFRVLPRCGFSHAAAMTMRQMMMYGMVVAMTMLSLRTVNVPLTIFAFLGGAAAIGVGFGSQNTVANFISGLILLIQRPIRIGDLVNVDGIDANVEHIGARATRVRTSENLEVLIPNNNILQNKVTNWTLSDTRVRTSVTVGVAYGTEVQPVVETLQRVVIRNPKVLADPIPIVLFEDFGDSSLVFKVHFWIHMRTIMEGNEARSEIRVAIDAAFRREGIVIAFPQRDVHLDLSSPIEVTLSDNQRSLLRRPRRAA